MTMEGSDFHLYTEKMVFYISDKGLCSTSPKGFIM